MLISVEIKQRNFLKQRNNLKRKSLDKGGKVLTTSFFYPCLIVALLDDTKSRINLLLSISNFRRPVLQVHDFRH